MKTYLVIQKLQIVVQMPEQGESDNIAGLTADIQLLGMGQYQQEKSARERALCQLSVFDL